MKAELPLHAPGTQLDKGYIGQSVPRPNAQRLLQGRGTFIDDLRFPRLAHVVFFRSPHAHARIRKLELKKARLAKGVIGVFNGRDVAEFCTPGMLIAARDLQLNNPKAGRDEIRAHLSGNYCRCTGYQAIVDAVEEVLHGKG